MPTAVEALSSIPLFSALSARQVKKLVRSASEDRYEAGTTIVSQGGHTDTMFVILEGTAKVVRSGRTIARLSAGEFFGEISMIDGRSRSASVISESPIRCLVLYQDDLRKLVVGDPSVAWSLIQMLAGRIRGESP